MSDIYVGELQDEDGNTVYPHTEADVCFCTDGKNVQEKINNELLSKAKVLKTIEEIEANTNVENIAGATALKEVNNKLMFPDGTEFYLDIKNSKCGYNTDPARGADTFHPFSSKLTIRGTMYVDAQFHYNNAYHWHNVVTKQVTFSVEDAQASITIESGEKDINTVISASVGCVRSKLIISSVEIG